MKPIYIFNIFFYLFFLTPLKAQIRIEVVKYPEFSLSEKRLFLASDINNWDAADPNFELKKDEKGIYFIELPDSLSYFEYKFTQGAWALVEGTSRGLPRPNRIYDRKTEANPNYVLVNIENWERSPAYKFVIQNLPANTPHDASIYVAGNFNNWNPANPSYKMQKQGDGSYRLIIYSELDEIEFKFTRGTWESVEGKESGKARANRKLPKSNTGNVAKDIPIDIDSWEDLSGTFNYYSIYDLLMLFAALQGVLFIIAIPGIQDYNKRANRWLIFLMGFVSAIILIRVLWQHREIAQAYPKMLLIPDCIMFVYAPLFHFYLKKLLFRDEKLPYRWAYHFIPALVLFIAYLPYFLKDNRVFKIDIVNHSKELQILFWVAGIAGFIFNAYYWWINFKTFRLYREQYQTRYSYEQNIHYLNTVFFIQAACLILWFFTGIILGYNRIFNAQFDYDIIERSVDGMWFVFSIINYFLGYYAIHQPEVFKMPQPESSFFGNPTEMIPPQYKEVKTENKKEEIAEINEKVEVVETKQPDENIMALAEKVEEYLRKNRTFTNPNLSLNDLAQKLKMQPHILSKVINDGFDKNFFDFINAFRIEEFKKLAQDNRYKHHTFISLAFEVGFNSKTAFNRSFKKMNNQTPREFLSLVGHKEEEEV